MDVEPTYVAPSEMKDGMIFRAEGMEFVIGDLLEKEAENGERVYTFSLTILNELDLSLLKMCEYSLYNHYMKNGKLELRMRSDQRIKGGTIREA